jgi:hypothetical protein
MTATLIVVVLVLFGNISEDASSDFSFKGVITGIVFFLVLPIMYCKIILKEPLTALGLHGAKWFPAFFWGLLALGLEGVFMIFIASDPGFREAYRLPAFAERSFMWFIGYEILVVGGLALLYEVFFRGLVMRLWLAPIGAWSIIAQALLFSGFVALSSGISWQYAVFLYASLFSGAVAYFSGSVYASWVVTWATFLLIDIVFLVLR